MTAGERFKNWMDKTASGFADRLATWGVGMLARGATKTLEDMEPGAIESFKEAIIKIRDNPLTPPEMVTFYNRSLVPGNWLTELIAGLTMAIGAVPALLGAGVPLGNLIRYGQDKELKSYRLDPATLTRIWLRDKPAYDKFFDDLRDQGWNEERIAVAKELAKIIPPLADMVRFADFSAFDPEVIAKWRQFYDAPGFITDPMSLIGITNEEPRDWANKYWFSHYVQPGRYELGEMFRRSESWRIGATPEDATKLAELGVTEDDLTLAYRTMAYSEFWQKRLIELAKEIPTRVDVRRWWDMRTIDETELRSLYQRQGYFGKDLDNYVLWTKVYTDFPSLMARWSKGWITEDDVRRELTALGMPAERVETMIQEKIKPEEAARVEEGKTLTKTEIYKGVKQGFITSEQGIELIMDLGYNRAEAEYLMDINVAVLAGSPETFAEFKDLTTKYKIATGREAEPMPEEIKTAAAEVVKLTGEVEALERSIAEEQRGLIDQEVIPEETTKRLKTLQVKRNRAISTLEKAKSDYNRLVAEWKHGLP